MEERIRIMLPLLDERQRRIFLAVEAKSYGRGGITVVSRLSGVAPYTIRQEIREINSNNPVEPKESYHFCGYKEKRKHWQFQKQRAGIPQGKGAA